MKKERVRDKYWDPKDPKNDIDFVELSLTSDALDKVLSKYAPKLANDSPERQARTKKRKERLVRKIFKAAASTLTDRQLQIFVLRTVCSAKEKDIAKQLGVNQPYVSNVLRVSNRKIRNILRLETENTPEE